MFGRTAMFILVLLGAAACAEETAPPTVSEHPEPAAGSSSESGQAGLDLTRSEDSLRAFAKMRCSLDPEQTTIAWWYGTIFADLPDAAPRPILRFEGFNACRMIAHVDGGFQMLSREVTYYQDLASGEIIERWDNPLNGQTVDVVQVANDPVSHQMPLAPGRDYSAWPWRRVEDQLLLIMDIPLDYPNPLAPAEFPQQSSGPRYQASEHFTFFAPWAEVNDPETNSTALHYGWARTGPWLPWMNMGQAPGGLIYSGQGMKLAAGYEGLPEAIQAYTDRHFPAYRTAPETYYQPNATSWNVYRKLIEQQRQDAAEAGADEGR